MITASGWLLFYAFAAPLNPDYNYRGTTSVSSVEQCIQQAKTVWQRHYNYVIPAWVTGEMSVACRNRRNQYDYRAIICDKSMNCEVKG